MRHFAQLHRCLVSLIFIVEFMVSNVVAVGSFCHYLQSYFSYNTAQDVTLSRESTSNLKMSYLVLFKITCSRAR